MTTVAPLPSGETPSPRWDLFSGQFDAIADVVISSARQVDTIANEWAIIIDTVGRAERLELNQALLSS